MTTGLTTVLNEQPLFVQPVVKPGCTTGLTTGLTAGCISSILFPALSSPPSSYPCHLPSLSSFLSVPLPPHNLKFEIYGHPAGSSATDSHWLAVSSLWWNITKDVDLHYSLMWRLSQTFFLLYFLCVPFLPNFRPFIFLPLFSSFYLSLHCRKTVLLSAIR